MLLKVDKIPVHTESVSVIFISADSVILCNELVYISWVPCIFHK